MTKDEALKRAREALEDATTFTGAWPVGRKAITAINEALAAPVQEPVAWSRASFIEDDDGRQIGTDEPEISWSKEPPDKFGWSPLYTTQPNVVTPLAAQPALKPLTDEWIRSMCKETWAFETVKQWVRIAEAAHGIKG